MDRRSLVAGLAVGAVGLPFAAKAQDVTRAIIGPYNFTRVNSSVQNLAIKSAAGILHSITINVTTSQASFELLDGNSSSGTGVIVNWANNLPPVGTLTYDAAFQTGLWLVVSNSSTTNPDITFTWR